MWSNALDYSMSNGHLDIVRLLLSKGANKDKAANNGYTPLFVGSQNGHMEVVQVLLSKGADKDKCDLYDHNALHAACAHGHTNVAKVLLLANVDKDKTNKCRTEEMIAELENLQDISQSCAVRRKGRRCSSCDIQEAIGVGTIGGPPKFMVCSRCRGVAYCSKECQSADWKDVHKAECKVMQGQWQKSPSICGNGGGGGK